MNSDRFLLTLKPAGYANVMHNEHLKEKLTPEQLQRCRYQRCYKWVELIHTNASGEFFFFVAMHLGRGKSHECPILYELVEQFLEMVGEGIMKRLIVDRGFLDGEHLLQLLKIFPQCLNCNISFFIIDI